MAEKIITCAITSRYTAPPIVLAVVVSRGFDTREDTREWRRCLSYGSLGDRCLMWTSRGNREQVSGVTWC